MTAPHFGVRCGTCSELAAVPISAESVDRDPVAILRSLSEKDRQEIVDFWAAHQQHGDLAPCVVDIEEKA